jgi:hypothetical protein
VERGRILVLGVAVGGYVRVPPYDAVDPDPPEPLISYREGEIRFPHDA